MSRLLNQSDFPMTIGVLWLVVPIALLGELTEESSLRVSGQVVLRR